MIGPMPCGPDGYAGGMVDTPPGDTSDRSTPAPPDAQTTALSETRPETATYAVPPVVTAGGRTFAFAHGAGMFVVRVVVMIVAILAIAGSAVWMLFQLGESLGLQALIIGLAAAIVPVPVLVACFLWLDRYEPEPILALVFCFAWGASVSTATSLFVNSTAGELFESWRLPDSLVAVLVAPFIEELTKALGPILLLLLWRREWSGITDGIVYCGLSAVGFAMVENILYLGGHGYRAGVELYGPATGVQNLFVVFILRILLTGFAHPLFTSMTGVGLGVAARSADRRVRLFAPLSGLLLAMMLHGTWNLVPSLVLLTGQALILLYGYISVMMPIFFGMIGLAVWLRSWEGRLTERRLPDYVRAGWLTPPEVASLGSLGRRHAARQWARRVAGLEGLRAMREYQFAATRLALLRDGMLRGLDSREAGRARAIREERRLLDTITAARRVFVGRDPLAPVGFWDGERYHLHFPDGVRRVVPAPDEPVVPIPVLLTPAVAPGQGARHPGYHQPQPGLGGVPSFGPQPGHAGPQPGHVAQPGHAGAAQPGYAGPPWYGAPPSGHHGPQPGHGSPQSPHGSPQPGYGAPPPGQGAPGHGQSPYGSPPR